MPERVYDKINYQTNFTSTKTYAILLRSIKEKGIVDSDYARITLFPNARSNAGMSYDPTNRDTHGEISLQQYGLIDYVGDRKFTLSALGERFLELFDSNNNEKENNEFNYVSTMIDSLFSWKDEKKGRNINVGLLLCKLLLDDRLNCFITAEEWSYVAEISGIRNDNEYDNLVNNLVINREKGETFPLKKADVLLGGFVGTWKILEKETIENETRYKLREITKQIIKEKLKQIDKLKNSQIKLVEEEKMKKQLHSNPRNGGDNVIYYGAPGCGKSHQVKKDLNPVPEENKYRVTFHPEYTNSDFVGQIMPRIERNGEGEEIVKYIFNPGPFTKTLERALTTDDPVFLVIEEINRGNAAAIFGDLFQLLDRQQALDENGNENPDFGKSEYEITNPNIEDYLKEQIELPDNFKIYIPRNMRIRATMNSSDQNVFTLDTAFKRRWDFEQISNEFNDDDIKRFKGLYIPGTEVEWKDFLEKINPEILKYKIRNSTNEDKQLGKYFINEACLTKGFIKIENCQNEANRFAYKVLEYLWNDVCKIDKDDWFDTAKYQTLEKLIDGFMKPGNNQNPLSVFKGIDFSKK